ncbi:MAG: Nif3-like dinuclear metal center hexameric protein [Acidobacteriaceae bacterium]|nr:Nif3-like dinuclear metal center hexameric protein [Acidobacteriaceae bacterium]MBV9938357.1 Nif3-like dinuclear metal center hexameric protein [Acidobacteriaceae bacterium]
MLTARQVIERIQKQIGIAMPENTVDTFKAGDPDKPVTGIAVTMMATYDVLERAAASGKNLVITHEPTFYNHRDTTAELAQANDPVLAAKQDFITKHGLVVWRFHDGWHARKPDGILLGMTRALGWAHYQNPENAHLFQLPETTVGKLADTVQRKLNIQNLRVVGDRNMQLTKVALLPGAAGPAPQMRLLERDDVQALLIGEVPEWETIEYVADAVSEGKHKSLLLLGHIPSEQAGMDECALWLRTFIKEVPVEFIPAKEMFWSVKP